MEPREEAVEKQFKTVMTMAAIQTRESEEIEASLADLKTEIDRLEDKQIKVRKERQFLAERAFRLEGALQEAFLVRLDEKTTELGSASKELHAKVKEIVERYTSPMIAISRLRRDADMLLAELPPLSADRLQNEWREQ
ncbi:MAG TPA: hypothetical protein VM532_17930, partial [Burkholderiales bacterium]|nr:hypothetical protein [Burkholderiales bacterium]